MEETHLEEFNMFNEIWDNRMVQFNERAQQLEEEMIEKHKGELEEFLRSLDESLPEKPKDSSELLNMRKIEDNLVK